MSDQQAIMVLLDAMESNIRALRAVLAPSPPQLVPVPTPGEPCTHPKTKRKLLTSMGDGQVEMCMVCGETDVE